MRFNKVDPKKALELFKKGYTPKRASQEFGVSSMAMIYWHKKFIKEGLLPPKRIRRKGIARRAKTTITPDIIPFVDLDEGVVALIKMMELAKQVPDLMREVYRLKNILAATENELKILKEDAQEREEQKRRWNLAVQQGEIIPVGVPGIVKCSANPEEERRTIIDLLNTEIALENPPELTINRNKYLLGWNYTSN